MSWVTLLIAEDFDLKSLQTDNLYVGIVVELPFRLRLGRFHKEVLVSESHEVQLGFINRIDVPTENVAESIQHTEAFRKGFATAAVALVPIRKPSLELLEGLRSWDGTGDPPPYPGATDELSAVRSAIARFVVAYSHAGRQWWGGTTLRRIPDMDFYHSVQWQVTYVLPAHASFDEDDFRALADRTPPRYLKTSSGMASGYHDLEVEAISRISHLLKEQESQLYQELAFEGRSRMIDSDYTIGLLMAVASLESAHAAFVQQRLRTALPPKANAGKLADDMLRELGVSLSLDLTPYLFLDEVDWPDPELIQRAKKSLNMRNEIMHALRNSKGVYKARTRPKMDLAHGTVAALDLAEYFMKQVRAGEMLNAQPDRLVSNSNTVANAV
jgi:hypothetical protein